MRDDLARLGVRGRHLLTPFRGLHLGVVQLLPRLADPPSSVEQAGAPNTLGATKLIEDFCCS